MKFYALFFLSCFLFLQFVFAQQDPVKKPVVPSGICFSYGQGKYSFTDNYFSSEKYSGYLPCLSVSWINEHQSYVYSLEFSYRNSDNIKNNNVKTNATQLSIIQGFLYPVYDGKIFKKDCSLIMGPSMDVFFFMNDPDFAVSGFEYTKSQATLASLGINSLLLLPLSDNFQVEASLKSSILSFAVRSVDLEEDSNESAKLLTLYSANNSSLEVGGRYFFSELFSFRLSYKFELFRISEWNRVISASDNITLGLTLSL